MQEILVTHMHIVLARHWYRGRCGVIFARDCCRQWQHCTSSSLALATLPKCALFDLSCVLLRFVSHSVNRVMVATLATATAWAIESDFEVSSSEDMGQGLYVVKSSINHHRGHIQPHCSNIAWSCPAKNGSMTWFFFIFPLFPSHGMFLSLSPPKNWLTLGCQKYINRRVCYGLI